MKNHRFYLLLCLICLCGLNIQAQERLFFNHIGIEKGLSQSTVFDIAQDTKGNMWFATYGGLNRYDGYDFTVYQHETANPESIGGDIIHTIKIDETGRIWIGTNAGLSYYEHKKDRFTNFSHKKNDRDVQVHEIIDIDSDHLLVNTSGGLFLFHIPEARFTRDQLDASLFEQKVTALYRFEDTLYIGTDKGLLTYSLSTHALHPLITEALAHKNILVILRQSEHSLWIGTEGNGLYKVNPSTKELKQYHTNGAGGLSSNFVRSLALDAQKRLWVGTFTFLNIYDEEKDTFTVYDSNQLHEGSLSQSSIRSIFMDSQGGMWLGTYFGGLNYYHPLRERFRNIRNIPTQNSLNDNVIGCIMEEGDGNLWIGTNNGGVNYYNASIDLFTHYTMKNGLGSNDIKAIYTDPHNHKVYIGTHTGGLNILDRTTGRIECLTPNNSNLTDNNVYAIVPGENGNLWLGTMNTLVSFDPIKKSFTTITTQKDGTPFRSTRIRTIFRDSKKRLWIGGEDGLSVYTRQEEELSDCKLLPDSTMLKHAFIYCIHEAHNGIVWIGTRNGLYRFNEREHTLKRFLVADGLPNQVIYGILEDTYGRLWLSTDKGLSCFHTEAEKFRNFTYIDGLQSNQFTSYAYCKKKNGEMYFGGIDGITVFQPELLTDNTHIPPVVISSLNLFNIPVRADDKTGILTQHISETGHITLKNEQSSFSLGFVVSNYIAGTHNTFAYQLKGYDKDWYYVDEYHRWATYTNLPAGKYEFWVKAANNDGKWNENPTILQITILPAWYQTWWAITLFILAGLGIVGLLFYYQLESMNKKRNEELQEMKTRFFIDISHELRTPLTLILAPLQELMARVNDRWTRNQLEYIKRNTDRLLHLVNQLMDYRRAEKGVFELRVKANNVHAIVEKNFRFYEQLAKRKQIIYDFQSDLLEKPVYCDANYLELVLNNLLSNAFKYTDKGQSITVILKEKGSDLLLQVKDTGAGIPVDKQAKIFERFYQVENEHLGSGIGLSLVQKLVELHHGRLELDSVVNEGSCFSIYLPKDKDAYKEEELATENTREQVYSTNVKDMYIVDTEQTEANLSPETAPSGSEIRNKKETILIVEDNEEIQQYLSEELSKTFITLEAGNGEEALEIVKENEIGLIVTDVMMPVMDGIKLCRSIKQNLKTCHIPVIILSAKAELGEQLEGLQVGADDYIPKPFSLSIIVTKIKNMLRTRYRSIEHYSNSLEIEPEKIALNPLDEEFLKKAVAIVEKHMDDIEFSTDEFARELYMSRSSLHMKMKAVTGESTAEFIRKIRFNHACKLLKEGRYNVAEISLMVGFNTPSYFATCFKKYIGCLPSEYVKNGGIQQN